MALAGELVGFLAVDFLGGKDRWGLQLFANKFFDGGGDELFGKAMIPPRLVPQIPGGARHSPLVRGRLNDVAGAVVGIGSGTELNGGQIGFVQLEKI